MVHNGQFKSIVFLDGIRYHIKLIHKKDVNKDNEKSIHDTYDNHVSIIRKSDFYSNINSDSESDDESDNEYISDNDSLVKNV